MTREVGGSKPSLRVASHVRSSRVLRHPGVTSHDAALHALTALLDRLDALSEDAATDVRRAEDGGEEDNDFNSGIVVGLERAIGAVEELQVELQKSAIAAAALIQTMRDAGPPN